MADAAVSVLVIVGLLLARAFGWLWMDPLAGIVGACVIASWAYGLVRDTGAILLDMSLGPGHLGAIVSVTTDSDRGADFYRGKLSAFASLSHVTVEVARAT